MIPILYEASETLFSSNGIGRLRDCISCTVTEERNGVYECDFEYPVTGQHFDDIIEGRIITVTHDDSGDVQPFEIISHTKPLSGVVNFHAVHISYKLSGVVVAGSDINSLADALTMLGTAEPSNRFTFDTDMSSSAYMAAADGIPHSVRQLMGGVEGSILDAYGGEYEFDGWDVHLWKRRGADRDLTIRYGLNLVDYNEEADYSGIYTAVMPYWKGTDNSIVVCPMITADKVSYNGYEICVPLDMSEKFKTKPAELILAAKAHDYLAGLDSELPATTIKVDFVRLQDQPEYAQYSQLMECNLCDTIRLELPMYGLSTRIKIVKTVYNVLLERYDELELGTLSTSITEAISSGLQSGSGNATPLLVTDTVTETIATDSADHTIAVSKDGYTPIGIIGWDWSGTGTATCYMNRLSLSGSNVVVNSYRAAGSVNATLTVNILFLSTGN